MQDILALTQMWNLLDTQLNTLTLERAALTASTDQAIKALEDDRTLVENVLMRAMQDAKVTSQSTPFAIMELNVTRSPQLASDPNEYMKYLCWLLEDPTLERFQEWVPKQVKKPAFGAAIKTGVLPPGVTAYSEVKFSIKRPKQSKPF